MTSILTVDDEAALGGTEASVTIDVLANDSTLGGTLDPATVKVVSGPASGSTTVGPDGSITYTAPLDIDHTSVSFDYEACVLGDSTCATATVVVTIGRRFVAPATAQQFADVPPGAYFSTPVAWMVANNITTGTSAITFSPHQCVTRGELATFIFRLVEPEWTSSATPFTDVPAGKFYSVPVAWMVAEGLTNGTSPTTFSPGRCVTRGELATFFLRLAGVDWTSTDTPFDDVDPGAFYAAPVAWMVAANITQGTSATTFSPADFVSRGQFAAFTYRLATGTGWRP